MSGITVAVKAAVRWVLVAGVALVVVALALLLTEQAPRRAGSNYVPEVGPTVVLHGIDRFCEDAGVVPADAATLRLLVGTYGEPVPRLRVSVRDRSGGLITSGSRPAGGAEGHVTLPVRRVESTTAPARACIVTDSPAGRTVLYGTNGLVRLDWARDGRESWLALLPTIAHRFGLGKPNPIGSWLIVLALGLLVAAWAAAIRLVLTDPAP